MMIALEKQVEFVAAILTAASLYLVSAGEPVGWFLSVLGSILWTALAVKLNLWFMAALNITLAVIAVNAIQAI